MSTIILLLFLDRFSLKKQGVNNDNQVSPLPNNRESTINKYEGKYIKGITYAGWEVKEHEDNANNNMLAEGEYSGLVSLEIFYESKLVFFSEVLMV